jgi:phage antirepressor YoqD-like protein
MDDIIVDEIFDLVRNSNGIKASEIAKQLKISRKEVNQILYGRLAKVCVQDEQYSWHCNSTDTGSNSVKSQLEKMEEAFVNKDFKVEDLEKFLNNNN